MFGEKKMQHISTNTSLHLLNTVVPERLIIWACFEATGLGHLAVNKLTMNSSV